MVYAKVSTGFRSGGFNGRPSQPGLPFSFAPEELSEYEIGFKGTLLDDSLRWNTALYMNETDDKQFSVLAAAEGASAPTAITTNAGKAEAQGLETELTYLVGEYWSIAATYAYIDAEIKSQEAVDPVTLEFGDVPDNLLPNVTYVPEHEWTLSLNYDRDFANMNVRGTAMYHWVDERIHNTESADFIAYSTSFTQAQAEAWQDASTTDAFGTLNLNVILTTLDERYSVSLWGKNVLDERAQQSSVAFILDPFYSYSTATYNEPRTWGVTLKANF